jgi:acyl carrier protein
LDTARALRDKIEIMRAEALHPEAFWALQDDLPYWVNITFSRPGGPGCFDVLLQRRDIAAWSRPLASFPPEVSPAKPWRMYGHNPIEAKRNRLLGSFLRSDLKTTLPDYMIPSTFVILDALPLTPNGKLDRKALPKPDGWISGLDNVHLAPSTPIEKDLASIWTEILGIQRVGIHDNFFDLGGHSLLATRVISRIRAAFKLDLPLRSLFEAPTLHGLAQQVQELKEKQVVAQGVKITRVARAQYRVQQTNQKS